MPAPSGSRAWRRRFTAPPTSSAGYVHGAASRIESVSAALRDRSIEDLLQNAGRLARSQPAALFGGAVLAGIALSRFLKSSESSVRR